MALSGNRKLTKIDANENGNGNDDSGVARIFVWRGRIEAPKAPRVAAPKVPRGVGEIFDYLIQKWRILMHIWDILTYLFSNSALQRKAEYSKNQQKKNKTNVK